jgi:hypothetical protein
MQEPMGGAKDMTIAVNPLKIKDRGPLIGTGSWRGCALTEKHYPTHEGGRHVAARACLGNPLLTQGCTHAGSPLGEQCRTGLIGAADLQAKAPLAKSGSVWQLR